MQSFECPHLPDILPRIVTEPWSIQRGDTVVQLPQRTPFDTTVNRHPQFPTDSLVDSSQDRLTDSDQLLQSLASSRTDSSDNSLDTLLPDLPPNRNGTSAVIESTFDATYNETFDRNPSYSLYGHCYL